MTIRNSIKAIIIKNDKVVLTKNIDKEGEFYLLPGGGQDKFETMHEALKRECLEEINVNVEVNELFLIREYIGGNHEFAEFDSEVHQIEYMFLCDIIDEENLGNGIIPDSMQIGVSWISLDMLPEIRLYPSVLKKKLLKSKEVYLGDVN